jgi:hypothetical protein
MKTSLDGNGIDIPATDAASARRPAVIENCILEEFDGGDLEKNGLN